MFAARKWASRLALGAALGLGAMSLAASQAEARGYVELYAGDGYGAYGYERAYRPPYRHYEERYYAPRYRDADWWRWHRWHERERWWHHHHRHDDDRWD